MILLLVVSTAVNAQIKVFEDFDVSMTPTGWTNSLNSSTLISRVTTVNSYGRAGVTAAVRANNYGVGTGNRARLETNTFTSGLTDTLVFDVADAAYPGYSDSLIIHVSNGTTFTRLIGWGTSQVLDTISGITTSAALTGGFIPTSSEWCRKRIPLPAGTTQIRFEFYSDFGNYTYIDNVLVGTPAAPLVVTGTKTNITSSTVTLAASVLPSIPTVTLSGIVLGTSPNPIIGGGGVIDSTTNPVVTSGNFTKNFVGLTNATTYYYRTYAENSLGITYGPDSTFTTASSASIPTVLRTPALLVTATSATIGGNITLNGGSTVTASGVVYSTSPNPILPGSTTVVDSTTNPLVLSGTYSFNISGLLSATKYYYRAYATNSVGTAYSVQDSFTTAPVVNFFPYAQNFDTVGVNTGWTSALVTGTANNWVVGAPTKSFISGAFSSPNAWVTKLTGNYDDNSNAAVVSPQFDFTSFTAAPILRFKHKFTCENGWDGLVVEMSVNGGAWNKVDNTVGTGTNFNTTSSTSWYNSTSTSGPIAPPKFSGAGSNSIYSSQVNGWITSKALLVGAAGQSNVKIRFRFGSDGSGNNEGWAIDNIEVFAPSAPVVSTGTNLNLTTTTVTLNGNITNDGGNTVTASGIVVGTSPAPTIGTFGVIDSATNPLVLTGTYNINVTGLFSATTYYYRAYAVNGVGTSYGPDSTFTTNSSAVIPTVFKTAATNVQGFSATVGGNITSDGGSTVLSSGIVYATTPNPALFGLGVIDSTTNPAVLAGTFSINPAGLTPSTKYYYRAYATNGVGTAYSVQDSFTTAPVVSFFPYAQNFDTVGVNTGFSSAPVVGTLNDWQVGTPTKTTLSAAFSTPNAWITKLSTAYSTSHDGALISPQFDFSALTANPILRFKHKFYTESCCDGGFLEISINGGAWTKVENTVGTGSNFNTTNGTAWYNNFTQGNSWSNLSSAYSTAVNGWITSSISLPGAAGQSNVRFRFRFITDTSLEYEGWEIDNVEVFAPSAPIVSTNTNLNITTTNVTLRGNIIDNGGNAITASGIVVGTSPAPTRGTFGVIDSATNPLVINGVYTLNITGLTPATTYYYRAYAVNGVGTSYGADSTFTTNSSAVIPTVFKNTATNVQEYSATVGGNITSDGGSTIIASGVVYATTPNPVLFGFGVIDSTTNPAVLSGNFSVNPAGLTPATKYYYSAYATNGVGTAYSVQDSFTTAPIVNYFPYAQNFDTVGVSTGWKSSIVSGTNNNWVLGTPAKTYLSGAYSGPNAWVTKLTGNYDDNTNAAIVSPQFDFSALTAAPIIKFKHKFTTETGWDALIVEISTNGGSSWTKLDNTVGTGANFNTTASTSWYNSTSTAGPIAPAKFSGTASNTIYSSQVNGWITSITTLTGAAGQSNVKVRFQFGSDGSGNGEGWAIDDIEVIIPSAPTVLTGTSNGITNAAVNLAGVITNNGGNNVTASGIVLSTSPAPTRGTFGVVDSTTNPLVGNGNFNINFTGLTAATTYYYRAYAVNGIGTSYGPDSSFTTNASAVPATVLRLPATNIQNNMVTIGGNITSDGGATVTASGIVYSLTNNPLLLGSGVVDSVTNPVVALGSFNVSPTGLTHSTKYYFRAYAINSAGTAYSALDSFTTAPIVSVFPYVQNFESGAGGWNSMLSSTNTSVNWILGFANANDWVLGTPAKTYLNGARSGTKAWVTGLTSAYSIDHDASVVSPQFNFSALSSDPVVRFNHKFKSESDWDGLIIEMSINGGFWTRVDSAVGTGTNFNTPVSYSWYNDDIDNVISGGILSPPYFSTDLGSASVYASQNNGWIQSAFRLPGAAGQSNVRFRFRFISDTYVVDEGWALDDIEVVNITTPTVAPTSLVASTTTANTMNVSWTNGNGEGRIVVARLSTTTAVAPSNNVIYNASSVFGSGSTTGTGNFVVYNGTGNSLTVTGLTSLTNYVFTVYDYNGKYMHTSFTTGATNNSTTLPVKLALFQVSKANKNVDLKWVTSSEINNKGFEVQRSIDGKRFTTISFVKGEGNSNRNITYTETDVNPFVSLNVDKLYYRLNQVDFDGKSTLSEVKMVTNNEPTNNDIKVYPNPFSNIVNVEINATESIETVVKITDITGKLVASQTVMLNIGVNHVSINNIDKLSNGVYFVSVTNNSTNEVVKVLKH